METVGNARSGLRAVAGYAGTAVVCGALLTWVMALGRADLSVPLVSGGDAALVMAQVKSALEHGWFLHNEHLGAPWAADFHGHPSADALHYLLMKLLALAVADPVRVANLYFLLTFPLTTLTALFVLRRFEIGWGPAVVVSLLYTFLPYHFARNVQQLFLASYYLIPPTVMVLVWIGLDQPVLCRRDETTGRLRLHLRGFEPPASLLIGLLVACAGIDYAAFAIFFLLVAGLYAAWARRRLSPLLTATGLTTVVGVGLTCNLLPSLLDAPRHGANVAAVAFAPGPSAAFALRITHLVLPIPGHRLASWVPFFRRDQSLHGVALGIVGSLGFLLLLGRFCLVRRPAGDKPRTLDVLGVLNGCGVLLGTAGSFGFLFGLVVSPWIRCYYRLTVYLGFFALFAVALLLERLARRAGKAWWSAALFPALLGMLLVGGVLDQTGAWCRPAYDVLRQEFQTDEAFVRRIEASLPAGAMVFQLPNVPFSEAGALYRLPAYDHLRPYLHSRTLHWSFGASRGGPGDRWQQAVSGRPAATLVENLALAGFSGLYLDRKGYVDGGAALEAQLSQALGTRPLVGSDGTRSFFDLAVYQAQLRERLPGSAWETAARRVFDFVDFTYGQGFSGPEGPDNDTTRWCAEQGEIHLDNTAPLPRRVRLTMAFNSGQVAPANLWIESNVLRERLAVRLMARTAFQKVVNLPPGRTTLRFRCDAARVDAPVPRVMVFRVHNFQLNELDDEEAARSTVAAAVPRPSPWSP
jgi:phosphoglycerol transferase